MLLKDVLHLYGIDAAIMTPDGQGSVLVIYPKSVEVCLNVIAYKQEMKGRRGGAEMHYTYFYPDLKLILRPLSSMTDEEAEDFGMMYEQGKYHSDTLEFDTRIGASTCYTGSESAAERITRLLKAGFDLFNLIPSGQAIDSSKI